MTPETVLDESRTAKLKTNLQRLGVCEMSVEQLNGIKSDLQTEIANCISSGSPSKKLPGFTETGIGTITADEWEKVEPGIALSCAFAGTNWVVSLIEKKADGSVEIRKLLSKNMDKAQKTHSTKSISLLMAETIKEAAEVGGVDTSLIKAVGIAFGFAQDNLKVEGGIDARLNGSSDSKGWKFTDGKEDISPDERPSIGIELLDALRNQGGNWISLKKFAFRNDTHGVAEDGQTLDDEMLPVGFVFGTGDNAAMGSINLESGKYPLSRDPVMQRMAQKGLLPDPSSAWQEYLMGGNYLLERASCAIELLGETGDVAFGKEIANAMLGAENKKLISDIAMSNNSSEVEKLLGIELQYPDMAPIIKLVCTTVLAQAGQLMGINIAATVLASGYDGTKDAAVPIEGNVFWNGFGVYQKARETVDMFIPGGKLRFVEANGMLGVGKVALVQTL